MSIYLHIPDIDGSVTHQNYNGWINCIDLEFEGITNQVSQVVGKTKDRVLHYPAFGKFIILKAVDKSSIGLFEHACNRKVISEIEIDYVASGNPDFTYAKYKLSKVIITHFGESYSTLDTAPRELIKLTFTTIEKTFIPRQSDNTLGSPLISGFNLEKGQLL